MRWSKVGARACLFKAPGCIWNSFTHSEGTSLPRWNEQKRKGEGKVGGKKCRHNWVSVRSDVVVAGKLASLIGGWSHLSTVILPPEVPCYFFTCSFTSTGTFLLLKFYVVVSCNFTPSVIPSYFYYILDLRSYVYYIKEIPCYFLLSWVLPPHTWLQGRFINLQISYVDSGFTSQPGPSGMRNFIPVRYGTVFLQNPGIPVFFGTV